MYYVKNDSQEQVALGEKLRQEAEEHPRIRQLKNLMLANYGVILVRSWEEKRVMASLSEWFSAPRGRETEGVQVSIRRWSSVEGLVPHRADADVDENTQEARNALEVVLKDRIDDKNRTLYIFRDLHHAMERDPSLVRHLRECVHRLRGKKNLLVLLSPWMELPRDLEKEIAVVDFPLPTSLELGRIVDKCHAGVSRSNQFRVEWSDLLRDRLIRACSGLTENEAADALATAVIEIGGIHGDMVASVLKAKQEAIRRVGCLEAIDATGGKEAVAGLEAMMEHIRERRIGFTALGRAQRLDPPKGLLALGVPGGGKSLAARAIADEFEIPLLRLDAGAAMGKYVGESEGNIREALKIAEAFGQCVLWVDEVGESLSNGEGDGGTTSRVIATLLTWMSERTAAVYVYFTANSVSKVPPALLRQGRIDAQFFVELPNLEARKAIFSIHLQKRGRSLKDFDLHTLASECEGYVGAEIEEAVISALYRAANEGRPPRTDDVLRALRTTIPMAVTQRPYIEELLTLVERGEAKRASRGERFRITDEWVQNILESRLER